MRRCKIFTGAGIVTDAACDTLMAMSNNSNTTLAAFEKLTSAIRSALESGRPVSVPEQERWMDLNFKYPRQTADCNDVFDEMYRQTAPVGVISRWDRWMFETYGNEGSTGSALFAGIALTFAMPHRKNDDAWRDAVWNDEALRHHVLRTNLVNKNRYGPVVHMLLSETTPALSQMEYIKGMQMAMRMFGPWALAIQWKEDVLENKRPPTHDVLQNSWWLYCQHEEDFNSEDKKNEVAALLHCYPQSLCGALAIYIATDTSMQYKDHMAPIFNMPAPTEDTSLLFFGLTYLQESYQKNPSTTHTWESARNAWPEPCQMLEMFLSLYPDVNEARQNIQVLGNSFEERYTSAVILPGLDSDFNQLP